MPTEGGVDNHSVALQPDDIILAVVGMTGAGKSSFISLCSDIKAQVGHRSDISCTDSISVHPVSFDSPLQRRVVLLDTPGFEQKTHRDVLTRLSSWATQNVPGSGSGESGQLAGIIYVHRINQTRLRGSARSSMKLIERICGNENSARVMLVTTAWDIEDARTAIQREQDLKTNKHFWGELVAKGSGVYKHYNSRDSAMAIMNQIVEDDRRAMLEENVQRLKQTLEQERSKFLRELKLEQEKALAALSEQKSNITAPLNDLIAKHQKQREEWKENQHGLIASLEIVHQEEMAQLQLQLDEKSKIINGLQKLGPTPTTAVNHAQSFPRSEILSHVKDALAGTEGKLQAQLMWKKYTGRCRIPQIMFTLSARNFLICGATSYKGHVSNSIWNEIPRNVDDRGFVSVTLGVQGSWLVHYHKPTSAFVDTKEPTFHCRYVLSRNFETCYPGLYKFLGSKLTIDKLMPFDESRYRSPEHFLALGPNQRYFYRASCDGGPIKKSYNLKLNAEGSSATRVWFGHNDNWLVETMENGAPFFKTKSRKDRTTRIPSYPGIEAMAEFLNKSSGKATLVALAMNPHKDTRFDPSQFIAFVEDRTNVQEEPQQAVMLSSNSVTAEVWSALRIVGRKDICWWNLRPGEECTTCGS